METNTLVERVQDFVQGRDGPAEWGSPLLSTTPTPIAIQQLARRLANAEHALAEMAQEVRQLAAQVADANP